MPVSRKKKSYEEELAPIRIYLDDIEYIVGVLEEAGAEVTLDTGEYTISNVEDLRELKQERLPDLTITFAPPRGSITLKPDRATLRLEEDSPLSRGLTEHVKKTLLGGKRPFAALLRSRGFRIAGIALFFLMSILSPLAIKELFPAWEYGRRLLASIVLLFVVGTPVWLFFILGLQPGDHTIIVLKERRDSPPFFKRNRDSIIISIIFTLIGLVLGWLIAQFQQGCFFGP